MTKFERLLEIEDFDSEFDFFTEFANSSLVPGICSNEDCDDVYEYEPDQDKGWCSNCQTNTVVSGFILGEII